VIRGGLNGVRGEWGTSTFEFTYIDTQIDLSLGQDLLSIINYQSTLQDARWNPFIMIDYVNIIIKCTCLHVSHKTALRLPTNNLT
jgi:hypothetical protein